MYLTRDEEQIYEGEAGWTKKKAMEILVAIGDLNNASRLIPIESAHVSGVSYKTIGDAFQFIENLEGRVAVKSTLNPMGMDRERWVEMNIPEEFADRQKRILAAYTSLGIAAECTCVPYLLEGCAPGAGSHIAWAESSAVLYANSVLGAMTNMEGAPSAICADRQNAPLWTPSAREQTAEAESARELHTHRCGLQRARVSYRAACR